MMYLASMNANCNFLSFECEIKLEGSLRLRMNIVMRVGCWV